MMDAKIRKRIREFIEDKEARRIEIKVPKNFKLPCTPRVWFNKFILTIQMKIPPYEWKNAMMRWTGMNIEKKVCIPHDIKIDPYFPQLITWRTSALVGGASKYDTHQIKDGKLIIGRIEIARETLAAGLVHIGPGAYIAKDSIIGINSYLDHPIGEGEFWGGKPARLIKKFTKEQIEQYSRSVPHTKSYYRTYRKKMDEFMKDKKMKVVRIPYGGKRGNAGNDWFKARNPLMIYLKGGTIEFTRLFPFKGFCKPFYSFIGTKMGKNVSIGRRLVVDHFFPEHLIIGDNVTIGDDVYMDGHEFTIAESMFGRTIIEDNVKIGNGVWVRTGVTVGKGAVIEPGSMVMKDVPPGEVWGGSPAKFKNKVEE